MIREFLGGALLKDWLLVLSAVVAIFVCLAGCASHDSTGFQEDEPFVLDEGTSATAKLLTYNVAGLPDIFSGSRPSLYHPMIGPRLGNFDIVLVQEDFWYHEDLAAEGSLRFVSIPTRKGLFRVGDGLNRFAASPFEGHTRITWRERYGVFGHSNDRLAPKGLAVATHRLSRYVSVDIYNLHMDAGGDKNDFLARQSQIEQLSEVMDERSGRRAVVVAGDWNLRDDRPDDRRLLAAFKTRFSLRDAREVLSIGHDRIDRILYRSSDEVEITPLSYSVESELFQDRDGIPLSDHDAVSVEFLFKSRP